MYTKRGMVNDGDSTTTTHPRDMMNKIVIREEVTDDWIVCRSASQPGFTDTKNVNALVHDEVVNSCGLVTD